MKKELAELLKIINSVGFASGLKVGIKKNAASKDFTVSLPGIKEKVWVRKGTSDWMAFKQVFIWKEYKYPIPFAPKTILDAGSNVGYAALWFARQFPEAQIVSLEPETTNFNMLKKNTAAYTNIHPIKAGLWGKSCYLKIVPTHMGNWGFRTEEVETESTDTIKALSIREIMQAHNWQTIDVLKMDIEGAEKNVFASDSREWLPKVKMIFLELHDGYDKDCSKTVFKALIEQDFTVDVMGENLVLFNQLYKN